ACAALSSRFIKELSEENPMYQTQTVIGQTVGSKDRPVEQCTWPNDVLNTIHDWVYTSNDIYNREMERIFHGDTWNFVALAAEIPDSGDYKRSYVGSTP